ncbi:MAG: DUF151 domain-containing protein [Planctomycetota bacterium]
MPEKLYEIAVRKVVPTDHGIAVLLGNDDHAFVMHIGSNEGAALIRALKEEHAERPLTHDLLEHVLDGFEVEIKHVVITDIVDRTFCATLTLEQRCKNGEAWSGLTNEVKIDARPRTASCSRSSATRRSSSPTPCSAGPQRDRQGEQAQEPLGLERLHQLPGPARQHGLRRAPGGRRGLNAPDPRAELRS